MKIMINCDEATTICDKSQYGEASLSDKILLNLHLLLCKCCKSYSKQNTLMSRLFGKYLTPCSDHEKLSKEEKSALEESLKKKLDEH